MTDTTTKLREHYGARGLTDRISSTLATIAPEVQTLSVAQVALLDQFHFRDVLASTELVGVAKIEAWARVLYSVFGNRGQSGPQSS